MKAKGIIFTLLVTLLISSACTPTETGEPTADVESIYTMAAETVVAELTETAAVNTPTRLPTATYVPAERTATPVPTSIIPTDTATPTKTATLPPTNPPEPSPTDEFCDNAAWVADVSVQDGTEMSPGQAFEKTWRIKNIGTCTWTEGYRLAFGYGENMNGQPRALGWTVAPNETVEVTVVFSAPLTAGSYQSYWRMGNTSGIPFGEFFYVDIVVR